MLNELLLNEFLRSNYDENEKKFLYSLKDEADHV